MGRSSLSEPYLLSPHVHVCVAGKHVVLLDLERDKYLSVEPAHRLSRWVKGWPVAEPPGVSTPPPDPAARSSGGRVPEDGLLSRMIAQGMLVTDPKIGKAAVPVVTTRPETSLLEFDLDTPLAATAVHLGHFLMAYAGAKSALQLRSIKAVVGAASRRRARTETRAAASPAELGKVRGLVGAFLYLRPVFFTARQACLLDSLTLLNFLARYRIFPQWVFGVTANPFYAHCWVQQGDAVFNDTPDFVRGFTPILVV